MYTSVFIKKKKLKKKKLKIRKEKTKKKKEKRKKWKKDNTNKWYMHKPKSVLKNEMHKILWHP